MPDVTYDQSEVTQPTTPEEVKEIVATIPPEDLAPAIVPQETPVVPERVEEKSSEQKDADAEVARLMEYLRGVVKAMYDEGFKMYAIDSAADIFKSLNIIQGSKTKEWQAKLEAAQKIDSDFYSLSSKDLNYVQEDTKDSQGTTV